MATSTMAINRRLKDSPIQPFHHLQHTGVESPLHRVQTRERRDTPYPGQLELGSGVLRALAGGGRRPSALSLTTTTATSETSSVIDLTAEESDQEDYDDDDDDGVDGQYDEDAYYDDDGDEEEDEEDTTNQRNVCVEQDGVGVVRDMMEGSCNIGEDEGSDIEDEEMVWSHDGHSDADDEDDDDEGGDDDEDGEEDMEPCDAEDGGGLQLEETLVSSVSLASSFSPQHAMWAEHGSESGNNQLMPTKRTSAKAGGDSSDEEGGSTSIPSTLEPCASAGPDETLAYGSGGYLGGDDESLTLDCDFILELLRDEGNPMFDLDQGIDVLELLPIEQQLQSPSQPAPVQYHYPQSEPEHQFIDEQAATQQQQQQHQPDASEGYYQVMASSSDNYHQQAIGDCGGEQAYEQQCSAPPQPYHYPPAPEVAPVSQLPQVLQPQCLSSTKTLAQLFGLPKPLYLSPSHPPTLSVLEHIGYTRRMRRPREGQLVLPPSLTPYLSQMTAFLAPASADADQEEAPPTQSVASPAYKRKESVTPASRRMRSRSEAKRGRVETASNHQRAAAAAAHPFYGGSSNQHEESQASHMEEGDTGAGQFHVDSLLTYLDSPMTVSFDASTPCSTPSSPASLRLSNPTSPAGMLHPATADLHSHLSALTRKAAPAATDPDALGEEDFLEEVMQFASQLEHELS